MSLDVAEFHAEVYTIVRLIPPCRVTSYGHIAKLAGMPNHSRHVGQALKFLPANTTPLIPWYRVIGASGTISSRGPGTDGARRQRNALVAEGVDVTDGRTGDFRIDLRTYGWFPTRDEVRAMQQIEAEDV
ncbi:MGMT family protein [Crepidotus variabilis]|uniref:MGMT family protein n=1 Tax=Crepidotus variabilis TaxID=179855 RepID=A0A9P6ER01_9AGAR|nr:MGMT family protein [Crepidotus variabilis]